MRQQRKSGVTPRADGSVSRWGTRRYCPPSSAVETDYSHCVAQSPWGSKLVTDIDADQSARTAISLSIISLAISAIMLVVTFLAYAEPIYEFFGELPPAKQRLRDQRAAEFVKALSADGSNILIDAKDIASPGSSAAKYLDTLAWLRLANPSRVTKTDVRQTSNGWSICSDSDATQCTEFTAFEFDDNDKVANARRQGYKLSELSMSGADTSNAWGIAVDPLVGRILLGSGRVQYVMRLFNTGDSPVTVHGCLRMDTDTGESLTSTSSTEFPLTVDKWRDPLVYCIFETTNNPQTHYVGLRIKVDDRNEVFWVTYGKS